MSENIFVVGANSEIAEAFNQINKSDDEGKKFFFVNEWNRASPVSARTVLLQGKNLYSEFDTAIVILNSIEFAKYYKFNVETITKSVDSMILGNSYITTELLNHFAEQGNGKLVFALLTTNEEKSILQEMGESAFVALAEGVAKRYASKNCEITLVNSDEENFILNVEWLFNYLENPVAQKNAISPQKACKWTKPGAKPTKILPFIKG